VAILVGCAGWDELRPFLDTGPPETTSRR